MVEELATPSNQKYAFKCTKVNQISFTMKPKTFSEVLVEMKRNSVAVIAYAGNRVYEGAHIVFKIVVDKPDVLSSILRLLGYRHSKMEVLHIVHPPSHEVLLSFWETIVEKEVDIYDTYAAEKNGWIFETFSVQELEQAVMSITA
jgi:hypothetical protein